MQVGELYNTDRYGLILVLSITSWHSNLYPYEQVYGVAVMIASTGRKTYGEFTQQDWDRMCAKS